MASIAGGGISANGKSNGNGAAHAAAADYEPVWIDTPECTACDECTNLNPKIFAYNGDKKAIVINAKGGSYKDIVKAAEKCTAGCIHPGTPFNPNEAGLDKLIQRAAKFQ
jgi:pyruvate-ferredoxin/flavodoxin oxidoreductase